MAHMQRVDMGHYISSKNYTSDNSIFIILQGTLIHNKEGCDCWIGFTSYNRYHQRNQKKRYSFYKFLMMWQCAMLSKVGGAALLAGSK